MLAGSYSKETAIGTCCNSGNNVSVPNNTISTAGGTVAKLYLCCIIDHTRLGFCFATGARVAGKAYAATAIARAAIEAVYILTRVFGACHEYCDAEYRNRKQCCQKDSPFHTFNF